MGDLRRENACFLLKRRICEEKILDFRVKWGISEEKSRVFCLNGRFEKTHDFRVKWGILEEKMLGFLVKWGICEEKTRDFRLNGVFEKRKFVIFT